MKEVLRMVEMRVDASKDAGVIDVLTWLRMKRFIKAAKLNAVCDDRDEMKELMAFIKSI